MIKFRYIVGFDTTGSIREIEAHHSFYNDVALAISLLQPREHEYTDIIIWIDNLVDNHGPFAYRVYKDGSDKLILLSRSEIDEIRERNAALRKADASPVKHVESGTEGNLNLPEMNHAAYKKNLNPFTLRIVSGEKKIVKLRDGTIVKPVWVEGSETELGYFTTKNKKYMWCPDGTSWTTDGLDMVSFVNSLDEI